MTGFACVKLVLFVGNGFACVGTGAFARPRRAKRRRFSESALTDSINQLPS
jgi:hypothetical protein